MNDAPSNKVGEKSPAGNQPISGNRLAKVIARAGLCSRREAEKWISAGRVGVNGNIVRTPAFNVSDDDKIEVDKNPLLARSGTRVWLYHKPVGLVVTEKDPEGRKTIFAELSKQGLPRTLSIGRLDINTEGLLLLTNDGGLKRILELPSTGWLRRYRVRAHGRVSEEQLSKLKDGIKVDGIKYGAIDASIERIKGANIWINVALREGKNREIKNVLAALGLQVNRLIRTSYGPFQLGDLPAGQIKIVKTRNLKEQLGKKLAVLAGVDFDSPLPEEGSNEKSKNLYNPNQRIGRKRPTRYQKQAMPHGRTGEQLNNKDENKIERKAAPHRKGNFEYRARPEYVPEEKDKRIVHFGGSRGAEEFEPKAKRKKFKEDDKKSFTFKARRERSERGEKGKPRNDSIDKFNKRPTRDGARPPYKNTRSPKTRK